MINSLSILDSPKSYWVATILKNKFPSILDGSSNNFEDYSHDYRLYDKACYYCEYKNFDCTPRDVREYLISNLSELDEYNNTLNKRFQKMVNQFEMDGVPIETLQIPEFIANKLKIDKFFSGFKVVRLSYQNLDKDYKTDNGWSFRKSTHKINLLSDEKYGRIKTENIDICEVGISRTDVILPNSTSELFNMEL